MVDEQGSQRSVRNRLMEQLHSLLTKFYSECGCTCEVTTRSVEVWN